VPPRPDVRAEAAARDRQRQLTKPPGSLGRLEELACWFAARARQPVPQTPRAEIWVFAADHGVAARGVSAFPQAVTRQMVANFAAGGAAINVLARLSACRIEIVDVGVATDGGTAPGVRNERVRAGSRDLASGAAMTLEETRVACAVGERCARESVARGVTLLIAGEMGIANSTAAACLICALTGAEPASVVGRGTGVDDATLAQKLAVVRGALLRAVSHPPHPPLRILAELGGFEIAALAGLYAEAARSGVPVLLDGYISGAAALVAEALVPAAREWMLASHRSAEAGHSITLAALGLEPLLDLGMRLGEGTGAAIALPIVRAALALHREMATFAEGGVSSGATAAS
jgi:nicotinate-nucleotide--dimethylbenzimidazole phosphoribosyltransferase